ncbi:MAG: methyltransferase [Methylicorpusculum sp.]|uniref:class I SAM-dependent methyltransferase n=1 Tax=Methylicorpusculum sp. TaxID=2713644 RepID=UPI00271C8498|nr:methyltransferase [Methylicorpusculum sp.]MDO8844356.1 methyltransferase [Methylicorpusculum sp.]MDO8940683.1 methyltransferase [Methylicorpusculum sp.]MDP2202688.1 methyltransferase [Methylicorpusculum sp.]
MKLILYKLPALLLLLICSAQAQSEMNLSQAIEGTHRSAENKARDRYRHPEETLRFFDVQNTMTVVELSPGAGWYTEILAPYLKDKGMLYAAHFSETAKIPYFIKSLTDFKSKLAANPEIYGAVELTALQPPEFTNIAPEGSCDRALTFRNVHNWMKDGQAEAVFAAAYKALKPGGIFGVVEHRSLPDATLDRQITSGYVSENQVITYAEKAGFKLLEKAEINANPKDTKDHPMGVWTLPPALKLGQQNRAHYLDIGESDRMTLKFIKP